MLDVPRAAGGTEACGPRLVHRVPQAPRLRRGRGLCLRRVPRDEAHARRRHRARPQHLHELPHAARPGRRGDLVQGVPLGVHVTHGDQGACTGCHVPHADPEAKVAACTSCHAKVALTDTGAHTGRELRRLPRRRTTSRRRRSRPCARIATCRGQARVDEPWPRRLRDLPRSLSAHSDGGAGVRQLPHEGAGERSHRPSEMPGLPRAAHGYPLRAGGLCARAMPNKNAGPHASVPGGCETCHRPHGPGGIASPPACASCHATAQLPALHTVPAHGTVQLLPLVARADALGPRDVHQRVPPGQARPPAASRRCARGATCSGGESWPPGGWSALCTCRRP